MRGKIGHTTDGIALDLHIRAEHLTNERFKAAKLYDEQLVVGFNTATKEFVSFEIDNGNPGDVFR